MQKRSMKKFIFLFGFVLLCIQCCKNTKEKQITTVISSKVSPEKKTQLTGRIVHPSSKLYEAARLGWDKLFSTYPAVIVYVQNTEDVKNAVTWALENGIAMRIRSG